MSDEPDVLKFGFTSQASKQVMENGGKEMLDELYKDCLLPTEKQIETCDITLGIDASNLKKTQSKF